LVFRNVTGLARQDRVTFNNETLEEEGGQATTKETRPKVGARRVTANEMRFALPTDLKAAAGES
jgi:hypothetical protein